LVSGSTTPAAERMRDKLANLDMIIPVILKEMEFHHPP